MLTSMSDTVQGLYHRKHINKLSSLYHKHTKGIT